MLLVQTNMKKKIAEFIVFCMLLLAINFIIDKNILSFKEITIGLLSLLISTEIFRDVD